MKFPSLATSLLLLATPFSLSALASSCSPTSRNIVIEDADDGEDADDAGGGGGTDGGDGSGGSGSGSGVACTDDDQCTETPDFPICIDETCSACRNDDDCGGDLPPVCSGNGRCVECISNEQCDSGICLNEEVCLDASQAVYALALTGSMDVDCGTQVKPCLYLQDALSKLTEQQAHLVLVPTDSAFSLSSYLYLEDSFPVVIHGNGVRIDISAGGFQINNAVVTLDGFHARSTGPAAETTLVGCGTSTLHITGGTFESSSNGISATGCQLLVDRSEFRDFGVEAIRAESSCGGSPQCEPLTEIRRSTFENVRTAVFTSVAGTRIENNLLRSCAMGDYQRCLYLLGDRAVVRFNTLVDSGNCTDTGLIACAGIDQVLSSNLTFGNTVAAGTCYDRVYVGCSSDGNAIDHALSEVAFPGVGNTTGDPLFVDGEAGDYRLEAGSPAIDAGSEDSPPEFDHYGVRRPVGDAPDIGAFEFAE